MKCFLIDDDEDDRDIFALALLKANAESNCITATNGEDALDLLRKQSDFIPDYIFLDLNMPLMDGRACLSELRKQARLDTVPIIIFTTSSYSKDIEDTLNLGASHYLVKPTSLNELVSILTSFFEGKLSGYRLSL
ncbi:response regulator [Flavobacterium cupreum]|uniref:Response regulator n=1 Tax=Flavobacterium cupreum TaxID=2133766 RepID=A0A434A5G3_9FLAO|nr:response regulator [Flavobacterium cupreum]RUT69544.1 response regulator [Flavobacterium cupreum]